MYKKSFFLLLILGFSICALVSDTVRGLTNTIPAENESRIIGKANEYFPSSTQPEIPLQVEDRECWTLVDSIIFNSYLQPGNYVGVTYDNTTNEITACSNFYELLNAEALTALEKCPQWIRPALENIFIQLEPNLQLEWAEVINNAIDPYIDEIAYSIANSSVEYLSSPYCYPEIFTENAMYLYTTDYFLNYVEIVDYGNSNSDENYYSTTLYWKINEDGEQVQVEVPKEIYYMYIVHPKITDEIPAFIDPDVIEDNATHNNNIVSPDQGVFWRSFFFYNNDPGYPLLKDELSISSVAWDITGNTPDDAIHKLNQWINNSMDFTSNSERPHQPVRIYRKHMGRCGEYADLTAAACRSVLIPCTSILAISEDHTWNEFWDEEWIQWEPVNGYINNPLVYENGWGKVFGSVFEIKSNGYLTPVTARYSEETATIIIYALDNMGNSIDGAKITLKVPGWDNWGYTDKDGKCTFIVGEGRTYYARMDSEIGNDPINSGEVYEIVTGSVNGETYTYSLNAAGTIAEVQYNSVVVPEDEVDDCKLIVDFNVPEQILKGSAIMGDLEISTFYNRIDEGSINFFMADLVNYLYFTDGQMFDTFNEYIGISEGEIEFNIPNDELWYAFFDKGDNLNNPQHIQGSARLYEYEVNLSDGDVVPSTTQLNANYPNPFNPITTITFDLSANISTKTELIVYNVKGQKVKHLLNVHLSAGQHSMIWNGKDDHESSVSSGIYFYQLKAGDVIQTKKMILMK